MPTYVKGDMWPVFNKTDLFLITTNSVIKDDGCLVMGAGIAKQAKLKYPGIDYALGQSILSKPNPIKYLLIVSDKWPEKKLGCFQTKYHWRDSSPIELIEASTKALFNFVQDKDIRVDIPLPGCGNGGLKLNQVKSILECLPDNVFIWSY